MCEPVQTSAARGFQVLPEAPSAHSPDFGIIQEILTSKLGIKPVSSRIAAPYKTSATNDCPWQVQLPDQHAFKEFPAGPEVRLIYPSPGSGVTVLASRVPGMPQPNGIPMSCVRFVKHVLRLREPGFGSGTAASVRFLGQPSHSRRLGSPLSLSCVCVRESSFVLLNALHGNMPAAGSRFRWSSPSPGCDMIVSRSCVPGGMQQNGTAAVQRVGVSKTPWIPFACLLHQSPQLQRALPLLLVRSSHGIPAKFPAGPAFTRSPSPGGMTVVGSSLPSIMRNCSTVASVQFPKLADCVLLPRAAAAMNPGTLIVLGNRAAVGHVLVCHSALRLSCVCVQTRRLCPHMLCGDMPAAGSRWSSPSLGCGMTVVGSRVPRMMQRNNYSAAASPEFLELVGSVHLPRATAATNSGTLIVLRKRAAVGRALARQPFQSQLLGSWTWPSSLCLFDNAVCAAVPCVPGFPWSSPSSGCGMTVSGSRMLGMTQHNSGRAAFARFPQLVACSHRLSTPRIHWIPSGFCTRAVACLPASFQVFGSWASSDSVQSLKLVGSALLPRGAAAMIPGTEIAATNSAALARESQCQTSQSRLLGSFTAPWDASLGCVSVPRSVLYYLEELSVAFPAGPRLRWSSRSPGCGMFVLGSRVPSIRQHNISTKASVQFRHLAVSTRLRGAAAMIPETFIVLRKRAVARKSRCQTSQSRRLASSTPFWDALRVVVPSVHRFDGLCARCPAAPAFRGSSPSLGCGMTVLGSRVPGMTQHNGSTVGSVLVAPMITGIFSSCNISAAACGTPQPQVFNSCAASVLALRRARELGMDFVLDTLTVTLPADPGLRWSFPRPGCCKTMMESRVPGVMPNNGITVGFVLLFRGARASSVIPTPIVLRERAVARASRCQTSIRVCRSACALSFWSSVGAPVPKLPEGIPFELARAPCALSWAPLKLSPSQVCSSHPAPLVSFSFHFGGPALHSRLLRMKQFKVGMQVAQIEQTHLQHKSKLAANPDGLTVETLLEGPRDAALVLFEGGTRSPPVELERIAGHLARLWPAAAASMTSVEKALHHGGFVALIHEPLTLAQSGESVILAGHSLGANVAQKVAECLDGAGVDVRGIVALDLRTTGRRAAQIPDFHPSLVPALAPRIRLETLQVALESPLVPFPPMPQRQFRLRSEVAQEATVPEMDKLLTDTDHFMLRQSHVWDIAASVYQKVKDSDRRHTNSLNSRACR
ncbi:unnamed protein product [Effrenium voratum]|nr:unnamed protein product [Effrenium voratum]